MCQSDSIFKLAIFAFIWINIVRAAQPQRREIIITDAVRRIQRDGYPVEVHTVETADGYLLTMHRVPFVRLGKVIADRPVVFLMTGIYASSDSWVLSGPNEALPYLLSDLGYDVWMGNNRGNIYSRNHSSFTPNMRQFWNFSWHEMGIFDLSAMVDYALDRTKQKSLHFAGVSQGATLFLVLTSVLPHYNAKFRTAQLMAPVAFVNNMQGSMAKVFAPILGTRNLLSILLEGFEMYSTSRFFKEFLSMNCMEDEPMRVCVSRIWPAIGYETKYLNRTLLPEVVANFPVGGSFKQMMHYLQLYNSGKFQEYDYGPLNNMLVYHQAKPPDYPLEKITVPVFIYYSQNDYIVAVKDVARLAARLPNVQGILKIPWDKWNHLDFICGVRVKELIFNNAINVIKNFDVN